MEIVKEEDENSPNKTGKPGKVPAWKAKIQSTPVRVILLGGKGTGKTNFSKLIGLVSNFQQQTSEFNEEAAKQIAGFVI